MSWFTFLCLAALLYYSSAGDMQPADPDVEILNYSEEDAASPPDDIQGRMQKIIDLINQIIEIELTPILKNLDSTHQKFYIDLAKEEVKSFLNMVSSGLVESLKSSSKSVEDVSDNSDEDTTFTPEKIQDRVQNIVYQIGETIETELAPMLENLGPEYQTLYFDLAEEKIKNFINMVTNALDSKSPEGPDGPEDDVESKEPDFDDFYPYFPYDRYVGFYRAD